LGETIVQRRRFFLAAACFMPVASLAQSSFVGQWQGDVEGIGKTRLVITAIKPSGQVEGRIEFELQSYVATFGDKADSTKNTSYGVVSGMALTIEAALGGKYELVLDGGKLTGTYSRGTTFHGKAGFSRA
jgi:hypothetical protein